MVFCVLYTGNVVDNIISQYSTLFARPCNIGNVIEFPVTGRT